MDHGRTRVRGVTIIPDNSSWPCPKADRLTAYRPEDDSLCYIREVLDVKSIGMDPIIGPTMADDAESPNAPERN